MRLASGTRGYLPGYNYYYRCGKYTERCCDNRGGIRVEKVETALIDALVSRAKEIADWYAKGDPVEMNLMPPEILELQQTLESLEKLPYNPSIERSKTELRNQINEKIAAHSEAKEQAFSRDEMLAELIDRKFWSDADIETKVTLYNTFVSTIWVDNKQVTRVDFK